MFKQIMIGLFAVSMIPVFWSESDAQTCSRRRTTNCCEAWEDVGGSLACVSWRPGSEVCEVAITGLNPEDSNSVLVRCEVEPVSGPGGSLTGTVLCRASSGGDLLAASTPTASDECRHTHTRGVGHQNDVPGHVADCEQATATITAANVGGFPLSEQTNSLSCDQKGVCRTTLEVDPEGCTGCCTNPDFPIFVSFIANEFRATTTFCPPGVEVSCTDVELLCKLDPSGNHYLCEPLPSD